MVTHDVRVQVTDNLDQIYVLTILAGNLNTRQSITADQARTFTVTALDDPGEQFAVARIEATSPVDYTPTGYVALRHKHNKVTFTHVDFNGGGEVIVQPASGLATIDGVVMQLEAFRGAVPALFEVGGGEGIGVKDGASQKYMDTDESITITAPDPEAFWTDIHFKFKALNNPATVAITFLTDGTQIETVYASLIAGANGYTHTLAVPFDAVQLSVVDGVLNLQNSVFYGQDGPGSMNMPEERVASQPFDIKETPQAFGLEGNYPNPFNPTTAITFSLPRQMHVRLAVYDVLGREVALLQDDVIGSGNHTVIFDAASLPAGAYLYQLQTPDGTHTKQMILLK